MKIDKVNVNFKMDEYVHLMMRKEALEEKKLIGEKINEIIIEYYQRKERNK